MSDLGNKEVFAKNLNFYMNINKKDRNDVARDLDLPYTTVTSWCKGEFYPRIDKIQLLANYFDIQKSDLVENKERTDKLGNSVVPIPLLGIVKAGYDYLAQENWVGTIDINKKLAESGEFFALQVHGDSMVPIFFEGDTVIIRKQNDCENNEVAVVIVNGDEGTLKKVKKLDDGGIKLIPYNRTINPATGEPYYEDKTFSKEEIEKLPVVIAGVFHELRRTELKF